MQNIYLTLGIFSMSAQAMLDLQRRWNLQGVQGWLHCYWSRELRRYLIFIDTNFSGFYEKYTVL